MMDASFFRCRGRTSVGLALLLTLLSLRESRANPVFADDPGIEVTLGALLPAASAPTPPASPAAPRALLPVDIVAQLDEAVQGEPASLPRLNGGGLLNAAERLQQLEEIRQRAVAAGLDTTSIDNSIRRMEGLVATDAPASGPPPNIGGCSFETVRDALAPMAGFIEINLQRLAAAFVPFRPGLLPEMVAHAQLDDERRRAAAIEFLSVMSEPPLTEAHRGLDTWSRERAEALDGAFGGNRWSALWHQEAAYPYIEHVIRFMASLMEAEQTYRQMLWYSADMWEVDSSKPGGRNYPDLELADLVNIYRPLVQLRGDLLREAAELADGLEGAGCTGAADHVRVLARHTLAIDSERAALAALGADHWARFYPRGFPDNSRSARFGMSGRFPFDFERYSHVTWWDDVTTVFSGVGDIPATPPEVAAEMIEKLLFDGQTVEAVLGPLPQPGGEPGGTAEGSPLPSAAAPPAGFADMAPGYDLPPVAQPRSDGGAGADLADQEWDDDAPAKPATPQAAGAAAESDHPTWLTVTGLGNWPQPSLDGFWRSPVLDDEEEDSLSHIVLSDEGTKLVASSVRDGEVHGPWIDMKREATADAWRGEVLTSLREPKGKCPRWRNGVLVARPGGLTVDAAWAGPKSNPDTCDLSETPDGGPFQLDRVIGTRFEAIVPGKYIHLLGVPSAGPTAAQYSAAVEFSCAGAGLPAASRRVTVSAGRVVDMGECRYQLVADSPGAFDIRVEFIGSDGVVMHADQLRAEIPGLPGLLQ